MCPFPIVVRSVWAKNGTFFVTCLTPRRISNEHECSISRYQWHVLIETERNVHIQSSAYVPQTGRKSIATLFWMKCRPCNDVSTSIEHSQKWSTNYMTGFGRMACIVLSSTQTDKKAVAAHMATLSNCNAKTESGMSHMHAYADSIPARKRDVIHA